MSELKATPGPWKVINERGFMAVYGNDRVVCDAWEMPEQIANAHLIAAAPRMYKALKSLVACINETSGSNASDALFDAMEAMKQARGES